MGASNSGATLTGRNGLTHSLTANRVTLIRGETCLIDDLSFTLQAGQLLLLNGRNGSGKTSLMKALVGLLDLESGSVLWDGEDVRHSRLAQRAALVWLGHRTGLKADFDPWREPQLRAQPARFPPTSTSSPCSSAWNC